MDPAAVEIFKILTLNNVDMEEITIDELQGHLSKSSFTSSELTSWSITRIQQASVLFMSPWDKIRLQESLFFL